MFKSSIIKDGKASELIEFKYEMASSPPEAHTRSVEVFDAAKDSAKKMQSSLSSSTYKIFGWMALFTGSFLVYYKLRFFTTCVKKNANFLFRFSSDENVMTINFR
jgi:hypothetical protein